MRIGIITMHRVYNFGSTLQAYALQEFLLKLGHEPYIIDYRFPTDTHLPKKTFLQKIKWFLTKKYLIYLRYFGGLENKRELLFQNFVKKNLRLTRRYNTQKSIYKHIPKMDLFITGSDQVWNPNHMNGDPVFFCDFAPEGTPIISYSSSFAIQNIPKNYKSMYSKYLSRYKHLSTREENGRKIILDLCSKKAKVVCDPTLLLSANDYEKLYSQANISIDGDYALVYILNYNFNPRPIIDKIAKYISEKLNLKAVFLYTPAIETYRPNNYEYIIYAGPNEFIKLIKDARYIITSSFHGCIFALNFQKQFYAVHDYNSGDNRISSLMNLFGINDNLIDINDSIDRFRINDIDYNVISPQIDKYRKDSSNYLRSSTSAL